MSEPRARKIDLTKANLWSIGLLIVLIPIYGLPYWALWGDTLLNGQLVEQLKESSPSAFFWGSMEVVLLMVFGIVIHELIHGLVWAQYAKSGWDSIQFGFLWKALAPYCHCTEAMPVRHYLKAVLAPGVVLGLGPAIVSLVNGSFTLLLFSWFLTVAAIGDFLMARMLLQEDQNALVKDMPDDAGFWVYDQKPLSSGDQKA
jgi:hypothetical protein